MEIGVSYVYGYGPFLAPDGCSNGCLGFHFEVRHHQMMIQCRQIDDGMQIPCLFRHQKQPAVEPERPSLWLPWASTACWRSWRLFLVWKVMLWRVSWGRCWKLRPTPSSIVLVARQVPSRLRHWWAKPARRAPTCILSTPACCWSLGCSRGLAMVGHIGTAPASPAGIGMKGLCVLSDSPLYGRWLTSRPQTIKHWRSGLLCLDRRRFLSDLGWGCFFACRMLRTRCCSTFGSEPRTCDPSNRAVHTLLRTCGWNTKFCSKASLHSNCRLDAAANSEDMAATCASWITANFSLSNSRLSKTTQIWLMRPWSPLMMHKWRIFLPVLQYPWPFSARSGNWLAVSNPQSRPWLVVWSGTEHPCVSSTCIAHHC